MSERKLVLASASAARRQLLAAVGLPFVIRPANVDEDAIRHRCTIEQRSACQTALALAEAKALRTSSSYSDDLVIGADQIAVARGAILTKASTVAEARASLARLRGRSHRLISVVVIVSEGRVLWRHAGIAVLHMRTFSDTFLDWYCDAHAEDILACVGGYRIEGVGIQLFERIEGDQSTIMGLPMLPLLAELRRLGFLHS